jgi:ubiquinone/menaquinone biosynthesis C-methylase UbiE
MRLQQADGVHTLYVKFDAGGGFGAWATSTTQRVPAGTEVQFKLADGSRLSLSTAAETAPQSANIMGVLAVWYEVPVQLDASQVSALANGYAEAARLLMGGGREIIREFSKGDTKKFAKSAVCMVNS